MQPVGRRCDGGAAARQRVRAGGGPTHPKMTACHFMMSLSQGAPFTPSGGSFCMRLKSRISRLLAGVDLRVASGSARVGEPAQQRAARAGAVGSCSRTWRPSAESESGVGRFGGLTADARMRWCNLVFALKPGTSSK